MPEDKTSIREMVWLLRLRQGCLPLAELTCNAIGAPWECVNQRGVAPSAPEFCVSSKGGTCSSRRNAQRPQSYPRDCNTGVTRRDTAPRPVDGFQKPRR